MSAEKQKIYTEKEVSKMFDTEFLPTIQEFAKRAKETLYEDKEIKFWEVKLQMQFSDLDKRLRYKDIEGQVRLQLIAITQEMIDEAAKENDQSPSELPQ